MKIDVIVTGTDELKRRTEKVSKRRMSAIVRNAVTYAATPISQVAKRLVPVDTRQLKKAISKKTRSYPNGTAVSVVGIAKEGFKAMLKSRRENRTVLRNPIKYAHLVEKGHQIAIGGKLSRKTRKGSGRSGGTVAPRPFMEPAYQQTKDQVIRRLQEKMSSGIERALQ